MSGEDYIYSGEDYIYFVSYSGKRNIEDKHNPLILSTDSFFGNTEVTSTTEITSIEDIEDAEEYIEASLDKVHSVKILNFSLLRVKKYEIHK